MNAEFKYKRIKPDEADVPNNPFHGLLFLSIQCMHYIGWLQANSPVHNKFFLFASF